MLSREAERRAQRPRSAASDPSPPLGGELSCCVQLDRAAILIVYAKPSPADT